MICYVGIIEYNNAKELARRSCPFENSLYARLKCFSGMLLNFAESTYLKAFFERIVSSSILNFFSDQNP